MTMARLSDARLDEVAWLADLPDMTIVSIDVCTAAALVAEVRAARRLAQEYVAEDSTNDDHDMFGACEAFLKGEWDEPNRS